MWAGEGLGEDGRAKGEGSDKKQGWGSGLKQVCEGTKYVGKIVH